MLKVVNTLLLIICTVGVMVDVGLKAEKIDALVRKWCGSIVVPKYKTEQGKFVYMWQLPDNNYNVTQVELVVTNIFQTIKVGNRNKKIPVAPESMITKIKVAGGYVPTGYTTKRKVKGGVVYTYSK